jgi:hypothetical protein
VILGWVAAQIILGFLLASLRGNQITCTPPFNFLVLRIVFGTIGKSVKFTIDGAKKKSDRPALFFEGVAF